MTRIQTLIAGLAAATVALASPCSASEGVTPTATPTATTSSSGCKSTSLPSGAVPGGPTRNISIGSHGVQRSYLITLPSTYKAGTPAPLYFSFSGASRNASEQQGLSEFSNPEFNAHGIAVYPQSINDLHWLSNPDIPDDTQPNDITFVLDMLDQLTGEYCVDESRIYAAGKSNGGGFVDLLACNATTAGRIAAFASVSGAYYEDSLYESCAPGRATVPFIEFHGLNDTTVPYVGKNGSTPSRTEPDVMTWLHQWAGRNGCSKDQVAKPNVTDGLFPQALVNRYSWSCGADGHLIDDVVVHYQEEHLGHIWPSTTDNDDCNTMPTQCPMGHYTFNATSVIMDFFSKWTLPK